MCVVHFNYVHIKYGSALSLDVQNKFIVYELFVCKRYEIDFAETQF